MTSAWVAGCVLLIVGCAAPSIEPCACPADHAALAERGPEGEPLVTVAVRDGLEWPHHLSRVKVALDGRLVHADVEDTHYGSEPQVLERVAFVPGEHVLAVRAVASYASTRTDGRDGCFVELRGHKAFVAADEPVLLLLELSSGSVLQRFDERPRMAIETQGVVEQDAVAFETKSSPAPECSDRAPLPFDDEHIEHGRRGAPDWPLSR